MDAENVGDGHTFFYMRKQAMVDYGGSNRWLWRPFCMNISRVGKSILFHSNIYLSSSSTLAGQMSSSQEPKSEIVKVGKQWSSSTTASFEGIWQQGLLTCRPTVRRWFEARNTSSSVSHQSRASDDGTKLNSV